MWHWLVDLFGPIFAVVGTAVVGGGAVTGFAFWLFKAFGERWLSSRFAERLESFRHEQAKEIERLKFQISRMLDRTVKLHQREFDVLPKAWRLVAKSYHTTCSVTSALQSYADVGRMGAEQLEEFLTDSPLQDWQKAELKEAADKNKYYQDAIFWCQLNDAKVAARKAAIYLETNGIFMPPEIRQKVDRLADLGWAALSEHQINKAHDIVPRLETRLTQFNTEAEPLFKSIEKDIQNRLWSAGERGETAARESAGDESSRPEQPPG